MPSEFINHFTRSLELSTPRPGSPFISHPSRPSLPQPSGEPVLRSTATASTFRRREKLHALLVSLKQGSISPAEVQRYAGSLQDILRADGAYITEATTDPEEAALEEAIIGKLTVAVYSDALDTYLNQAAEVEAEAEWWADIERSRTNVALYFLQTLPLRLVNVMRTVLRQLRVHQLPLSFSTLSPSSLRALFPSPSHFTLRPSHLTTALFPHLKNQPALTLAVLLPPSSSILSGYTNTSVILARVSRSVRRVANSASFAVRFATLPFELSRQECRYNRKTLERIRDERAEVLGKLAQLRAPLGGLVGRNIDPTAATLAKTEYTSLLDTLSQIISSKSESSSTSSSLLIPLTDLSQTLQSLSVSHIQLLRTQRLLRPSIFTRIWPSLLIVPPLSLYVYTSRTSWIPALFDMARDAKETARGFVEGWLVEPLVGVLRTVRAGGKGEVLVREEGVVADLESLERMTLSLARDALNYTPSQLETLAEQVRMGDLTPVMQAYEQDIRTPVRSALTGTLLRNAFIQVQKAKVDIDQALSGIDRLLKSQELTFAFVGVAPALAIVYAVLGAFSRMWSTSKGSGSWGGRKRRRAVWEGMRRIERLLIVHPTTPDAVSDSSTPIAPLPTGLLILSLTRLRSYALAYLPPRIRKPFLQDLGDLEDTNLGRDAKLRIVDRMWRCWGSGGERIVTF